MSESETSFTLDLHRLERKEEERRQKFYIRKKLMYKILS